MLMSGADYRESPRRFSPRVYLNGAQVSSLADEPLMARGVLSSEVRAITKNRHPGRGCIQGCMVASPDPKTIFLQKKTA